MLCLYLTCVRGNGQPTTLLGGLSLHFNHSIDHHFINLCFLYHPPSFGRGIVFKFSFIKKQKLQLYHPNSAVRKIIVKALFFRSLFNEEDEGAGKRLIVQLKFNDTLKIALIVR
uniref:Uncharacterized protein n=1 Tax=candidate division WOR-3 bacterium TaxID=2052148 RepID=A0A7C4XUK6_UNCW3